MGAESAMVQIKVDCSSCRRFGKSEPRTKRGRKSFLDLHREVLLDVVELVGLDRLRHDLIHEGHVALQVLELHVVVVLGVPPRRLVHLDVVALAPLVRVDVGDAVLGLAQRLVRLDVVDVLASRCLEVD